MQFRRAGLEDAEVLQALLHRAYAANAATGFNFTAATTDLALVHETIATAETWLLEAEGRLLGTVTLRRQASSINWLAVDPPAQGQGLGARLLAFAEARARQCGRRTIQLDTPVTHPWLPAFYQRHGFRRQRVTHWEGKAYDSVILEKALAPG